MRCPHPEEPALAGVSKDEAIEVELAIEPLRSRSNQNEGFRGKTL